MDRLVGLGMISVVLIGCSQTRERLPLADGLPPAGLPSELPMSQPATGSVPTPDVPPRPIRTSGFVPGINGDGEIEPPRIPGAASEQPVPSSSPSPAPELPPDSVPDLPAEVAEPTTAPAVGPEPRADNGVRPGADVEVEQASAIVEPESAIGEPVGEWAARVDNDIITWLELQSAVTRRMRELDPKTQAAPGVREALAASVLDHLIDRSLVIQKARRNEFKDEKRWEMINKAAVEFFERERLPALMNQMKAEDRYELERLLDERGESLDEIIDSFKLEFVYQQYLVANVTSKVRVDLPEMRAYYFENRDHEAFRREAEVTWSEVVVRYANHPTREEARSKIEEAVARLGRGEPFEEVARQLSEGPNAEQGGLWKTAPGSYAVVEVNEALESLSPGQISGVIEGPSGFHVVRLVSARPAGRKSFEEVQDAIRDIIRAEKEAELIDEYLADLYRGAVVTTVFAEYVPRHLREDAPGE